MAQYAVLIYAHDSAHAPDATPEDTESCDRHSDELAESGSMVIAYALTPRDMATSISGDTITDGPFVDSKEVAARVTRVAQAGSGWRWTAGPGQGRLASGTSSRPRCGPGGARPCARRWTTSRTVARGARARL